MASQMSNIHPAIVIKCKPSRGTRTLESLRAETLRPADLGSEVEFACHSGVIDCCHGIAIGWGARGCGGGATNKTACFEARIENLNQGIEFSVLVKIERYELFLCY